MSSSGETTSIAAVARRWAVELAPDVEHRLTGYCLELLRWNARVNLTGAKDLGDLVDEHLPDVFALSSLCPRGATVVDVGAGGGLPGVPFAMLRSDCSVTLVEPRSRRVAFLHAAVRMVVQGASVVRGRVEDLDSGSWSFALSRATFSPVDWIVHASRIVTPNGLAAVLAARPTGSVLGPGRLSDAVEYTTGSGAPRWAGIYRFT